MLFLIKFVCFGEALRLFKIQWSHQTLESRVWCDPLTSRYPLVPCRIGIVFCKDMVQLEFRSVSVLRQNLCIMYVPKISRIQTSLSNLMYHNVFKYLQRKTLKKKIPKILKTYLRYFPTKKSENGLAIWQGWIVNLAVKN